MEVLVLGSGTGVPWPGRAPSSVLVKARSKNLLLDMGPGALQRLTQEGVDWQALDAILLSHLHPDHTLDLWAYFFASRWPGFARKEEVVLVAGRGL
ncbi:MAG: ribonuclease Z, partial [Deltaproteobacteria bacterium]|nr:ribonuclease Z [Deltaproteobacteria bacterium]